MKRNLQSKFFSILFKEKYSFSFLFKDIYAGFSVGILSIPMALALSIVSGVRPEVGLSTALIAGLVVAILGGCRVQIAGPTGALGLLAYATINQFGYQGLAVATILAGIILIIMSFVHAGVIIKFIPYPVTIGFTSALAIILFMNQIPYFLGLKAQLPSDFFSKCRVIFSSLQNINLIPTLIGIFSIVIVVITPKYIKKIPGSFVALLLSSLIVFIFRIPAETIQDKFGEIINIFPKLQVPFISLNLIIQMIPSSIAIAILIGMEALLCAVVSDGMMSTRHRSDAELFAQGISNILCILFGGVPATGTLARTGTCIKSGAQTPFAGIFSVVTMIFLLVFMGKFISYIPLAALSGVIMVVAYNISEWRVFSKIFLSPKKDIAVMLTTFFLTLFTDLITALEIGVILAMFLVILNLVNTSKISSLKESLENTAEEKKEPFLQGIHEEIEIFEVFGPLFFAATEKFKTTLTRINRVPMVLIIRLRYVSFIDATALRALEDVFYKCKKDKTLLILSGVNFEIRKVLEKTKFINKIQSENVFSDMRNALEFANQFIVKQKTNESKEVVPSQQL